MVSLPTNRVRDFTFDARGVDLVGNEEVNSIT
jgi:hypothetical protein